jgi:diamine N-acetyltransferase
MGNVVVRRAVAGDVEQLGIIGPAAYAEAYSYLWDDPEAYVGQLATFSASAFADVLAKPNARLWVAEFGDRVVGFLNMKLDSPDPLGRRPGGAEIARVYLLASARNLRLGSRLFDAATTEACKHGATYLWLDAMVSADWARIAYARWGFSEIGARRFGGGVREELSNMVVLAKPLA